MVIRNIKKTKILFVIPNLNGGGAERVFVTYIKSLNKQKFNIKLALIEKTGPFVDLVPHDVQIIDLKGKRTRHSFIRLLKCVKQTQPDLIMSTTNRMNILILLVSRFINKQIKICVYEPSMPSAQFGHKHLQFYYLWLIRYLYPKADRIIAQTKAMKSEINHYFKISLDKIDVIINPVDKQFIDYSIKNEINPFTNKTINIVASGRIQHEKGFNFLINSFAKVIEIDQRFKLHILGNVGSQSYFEKLKSIIKKNKLEEHIMFMGFKNNPFPYYKFADLFVLSSLWEGLPNVVLEVLYLQTPLVVTDCIPFFHEVIEEGKNGYIIDYGNEKLMAEKILNYNKLIVENSISFSFNFNRYFEKIVKL